MYKVISYLKIRVFNGKNQNQIVSIIILVKNEKSKQAIFD
jgi:hypothetical protein